MQITPRPLVHADVPCASVSRDRLMDVLVCQGHDQGSLPALPPGGHRAGSRHGSRLQRQQQEARVRDSEEQGERLLLAGVSQAPSTPSFGRHVFGKCIFLGGPSPYVIWSPRQVLQILSSFLRACGPERKKYKIFLMYTECFEEYSFVIRSGRPGKHATRARILL